jgi:hypothetical protein
MASSTEILYYRAVVGSLTRSRPPTDPDLIEAQRNLRALMLERRVREALAADPPLTTEQVARIVGLLASSGGRS